MNRMEGLNMDKIELLGLNIFNTHKKEITFLESMISCLKKQIGWHYHLDLAWMLREIADLKEGALILDAGGYSGLAQFMLSELGYNVVNADFSNPPFTQKMINRYRDVMIRVNNPSRERFKNRYTQFLHGAHGVPIDIDGNDFPCMNIQDESETRSLISKSKHYPRHPEKTENGNLPYFLKNNVFDNCGKIFLYKSDLKEMRLMPDDFFDGVVSISALEHNDHNDFERCVDEMMRVTRQGGKMVMTVSASTADDWFHEDSKGWCYGENTIKKLFRLPNDISSNFTKIDSIADDLKKENNELHRRLASFHFKSGKNGMPWGIWNPQYLPVGIVKYKNSEEENRRNGKGTEIEAAKKSCLLSGTSHNGKSAHSLNEKGEELFNNGDLSGAMSAFTKAIEAAPGFATAYNNLGVLHWQEGEVQKASEYFAKALSIDPDDRDTILNCGKVLAVSQSIEEAKRLLSSYLEKHPHDDEISHLLESL